MSPVIVPHAHPLSMVNGVFNAVFLKGNAAGELMFYGRGAGKLPTASAVAADVIDAVRIAGDITPFWAGEKIEISHTDGNYLEILR
ncbi:hypothetical protein AGMMS49975_20450 [Clostridia bacterium]|nr:hypothetical protein AGMMS49975_20450 [Clostridia bacterium]